MKEVTIKEFQNHASKYVTQLPVLLTKYGMPIAKVVAVSYEIKDVTQEVVNNVTPKDIHDLYEKAVEPVKEEPTLVIRGRCSAPLCKLDATAMGKTFNEVSGELEDVPMCKVHAFKSLKEVLG